MGTCNPAAYDTCIFPYSDSLDFYSSPAPSSIREYLAICAHVTYLIGTPSHRPLNTVLLLRSRLSLVLIRESQVRYIIR